jgi:uncharacterized iron-regulated protein
MTKKILLFTIYYFLASNNHAATCPNINDIKNLHWQNWSGYTLENGTPLSNAAKIKFAANVQQFTLAEWMNEAPEGAAHCYYENEIPDQSYLGVFLARKNLIPNRHNNTWINENDDVMHCTAGINKCEFMEE